MRCWITLLGTLAIPSNSSYIILWNPFSLFIESREKVLGPGISLVGCFQVPLRGPSIVQRYALACVVKRAEVGLCQCLTLLSRLLIPHCRLGVVLRDTMAKFVESS